MPWEGTLYPEPHPLATNKIVEVAEDYHVAAINAIEAYCAKSRPKSKNVKVRVNTEESAVKPEPELKNTIGCNLNPSDGPGKPNSITTKTVKTLKAQS
ncbi:hypothetical protein Tco_0629685 [Tanacetum coccineum]|uniref:Uncharacterized protein n=1 Tax=Tanacetum coccineum TaxID=301880 RepID=A0ABQ4WTY8_9ASTR